MEKQKISVRVAGRNYNLVSSDPPEYVRRVANLVDRRLNETVLACFNLMDELLKAKDENTALKRRLMQAQAAEKNT